MALRRRVNRNWFAAAAAAAAAGASLNQAIFFTYARLSTPQGFFWLGIVAMAVTALYTLVYFPMW
jgi:Zn-dependent membrane protease YugP